MGKFDKSVADNKNLPDLRVIRTTFVFEHEEYCK